MKTRVKIFICGDFRREKRLNMLVYGFVSKNPHKVVAETVELQAVGWLRLSLKEPTWEWDRLRHLLIKLTWVGVD